MKRLKLLVLLILFFLSLTLNSQVLNGSFEEWQWWQLLVDSIEYPIKWHEITNNSPESLTKSNESVSGFYSANLASLNLVDGTLGPAYIGTKFKPIQNDYNLTFFYKIDSVSGEGNAVIRVYQRNSQGDYPQLLVKSFNELSEDFIEKEIAIHLPSLDTVQIAIGAVNRERPTGYDGFVRVLFDDVEMESVTGTIESSLLKEHLLYPNPSRGLIYIEPGHNIYKTYKVYSIHGLKLQEGILQNQIIELKYDGPLIIQLLDESNTLTNLRVLNICIKT